MPRIGKTEDTEYEILRSQCEP